MILFYMSPMYISFLNCKNLIKVFACIVALQKKVFARIFKGIVFQRDRECISGLWKQKMKRLKKKIRSYSESSLLLFSFNGDGIIFDYCIQFNCIRVFKDEVRDGILELFLDGTAERTGAKCRVVSQLSKLFLYFSFNF